MITRNDDHDASAAQSDQVIKIKLRITAHGQIRRRFLTGVEEPESFELRYDQIWNRLGKEVLEQLNFIEIGCCSDKKSHVKQ